MHKKILVLLCLLALVGYANAATLFEKTFAGMGYPDFSINKPASTECTTISFIFPSDKNAFAKENYPVLSISADFNPIASEAAGVDANLNGAELKNIKSTGFLCNEGDCWVRIRLPKNLLAEGKNTLDICLKSSNTTPRITLKNLSKIGLYKIADFYSEGAFITSYEKEEVLIGEKLKVTVSLHNAGSAPAEVELKYARPIAEYKTAFVFIEGKAYASGTVKPGESLKIEYIIKPRVLGSITLPPAAAYFKNEFGEKESIFSNLATFKAREPDKKIDAFIGKEKEVNVLGQKAKMNLNVKNSGRDFIYNIDVSLELPSSIRIEGETTKTIESIAPGETKTLAFEAEANNAGAFDLGCKITYIDLNQTESKCQNSKIVFENPGLSTEIIAAIVLVIIGIGVYVYLMKSK